MATPAQTGDERQAPPWACAAAIAVGALVVVLDSPSPWPSAGLGLASVALQLAAGKLVTRMRVARQTAGELTAATVAALLLAGSVATAGLGVPVVILAGAVLVGQAALCSIWQTSALAVVLGAAALAVTGAMVGAPGVAAAGAALGLAALGLACTTLLIQHQQQRSSLLRQMRRMQGDLQSHHSVEQELRATHDTLERKAILLSEGNRRMEREVEARRWAEEKALEVARVKDSFLHIVSHELRTPLNAVIGYTEILLEEDPELRLREVRGEHEKIHVSAHRLLEMIDDLLDLAKIEAGKSTVADESVEVAALAEHVLAAVAVAAEGNRNTLRLRCEDNLPPLHTDRAKLRRILVHLLGNACKFTRDGVVRLNVRVDREVRPCFIFEVSDTGIGMDAETLQRIFAPFVLADASTTRRYDGTGLGLAICGHYCAMLGGEIAATSVVGQGSTFTVRLPATRVDPRAAGVIVHSTF
ncbi:MAG: HAMP domain-containing histidine kinase [Nannocystis sp.]|uniref:sensor histidine kinase n=1 Tax=Nannocystis sp. TaxID=1962667 RepID=UPI00242690BF|nr:HAMP domain-containing sensor histidine kinase [Nannocystis sp.]MBK9754009.1 HAMP domain-containing histidine kinase [Nannocystis sp.]